MTVGAIETAPEGETVPPPPKPSLIRWPEALKSGALVAGSAALLLGLGTVVPGLTGVGLLLTLSGSAVALALYRRRLPGVAMTGAIGARIGLATGVLLVGALLVMLAAVGVWARFRAHGMAQIDAQWTAQMGVLLARTREAGSTAQGGKEAADEMTRLVGRPEFRAWTTLGSFGGAGVVLLAVMAVGGALAGAFSSGRSGGRAGLSS